MANRKRSDDKSQGYLFGEEPGQIIVDDPVRRETCKHRKERHSETIWPGETFKRMTMTCELCGRVRGRYPKE